MILVAEHIFKKTRETLAFEFILRQFTVLVPNQQETIKIALVFQPKYQTYVP